MTKFAAFFAMVVLGFSAVAWCDDAPATQPAEEPATRPATNPAAETKEVNATIDEALALVDKKDYGAVLQRFIPPDDLKRIMSTPGEFDAVTKQFTGAKVDEFVKALKQCKMQDAVVVSDTQITFKHADEQMDMTFIKVDGKWYVR